MKRLFALLLIALMILSSCKVASDGEAAAADQWVEKDENSGQSEKIDIHETKEEEPSQEPQEQDEKPQAEQSQEEKPQKEEGKDKKEEQDKKEDPKEPAASMVLKVEYSDTNKLERLTEGALGKNFDYEIYYYGIKNFYINVAGKSVELREALAKDPEILDGLYGEWKQDHGSQFAYYDGGSVEYPYETYNAARVYTCRSPYYSMDLVISKAAHLGELKDLLNVEYTDPLVERIEYGRQEFDGLERLTKGDLGEHFDYEIYYYGIKNFYIKVDGKTLELRDALKQDPEIIKKLYNYWNEDHKNGPICKDGGSREFPYLRYTAIRLHALREEYSAEDCTVKTGYNKDLIICPPKMSLSFVRELIMINPVELSGKEIYSATTADPYPLCLALKENGRFSFQFSSVSNFAAKGTYSKKGDKLILQTDKGEFDYKFVFEKVEGGYRFLAKESSEIPSYQYGEKTICPLTDGTLFKPYN